jgi:hypothetical protein
MFLLELFKKKNDEIPVSTIYYNSTFYQKCSSEAIPENLKVFIAIGQLGSGLSLAIIKHFDRQQAEHALKIALYSYENKWGGSVISSCLWESKKPLIIFERNLLEIDKKLPLYEALRVPFGSVYVMSSPR